MTPQMKVVISQFVSQSRFISSVYRNILYKSNNSDLHNLISNCSFYAIIHKCRDIEKIRDGISENASHCLYSIMAFFSFQIMSFVYGWKLSLVIISYMPLIMIISGVMEIVSD